MTRTWRISLPCQLHNVACWCCCCNRFPSASCSLWALLRRHHVTRWAELYGDNIIKRDVITSTNRLNKTVGSVDLITLKTQINKTVLPSWVALGDVNATWPKALHCYWNNSDPRFSGLLIYLVFTWYLPGIYLVRPHQTANNQVWP